MKKRILYKTVAVVLLVNSIVGCIKDDVVLTDPQNYTRPINFAGPIAKIHFGAKDLLEKIDTSSYFQIDETGLLHFQFDNLTLEGSYDIGAKRKSTTFTFEDSIVTNHDPNQRFDSLLIKESSLILSIVSPPGFTGTYTIDFPDIIKNGQAVSVTGNLNSNGQTVTDLANAKVFFQNQMNVSYCRINITVNVDGFPLPPVNSTIFSYTMTLDPFQPQIIFGYFGQIKIFEDKQEMQLDFFKSLNITDVIQFKDIRLDVLINNYFGAPLEIVFDSLLFTNETSGEEVNVTFNGGGNSMLVNSAVFGNPIVPSTDTLSFNADNSNLIDGINLGPTKIYTSLYGNINPNGETAPNFINTDLEIDGNLSIDIPFWFKTESYERTDTIGFDFLNKLDSTQIDYLDELNLYFDFTNGFPFNIVAQGYFVDSNNVVIDSLFNTAGGELLWKSGVIDANGKVTSPSITNVDVQILHDKARKLFDSKVAFIHLKSKVSTGDIDNPEFVKLYDSYTMNIKLSGELKSGTINY
jgi:hypothetical protein